MVSEGNLFLIVFFVVCLLVGTVALYLVLEVVYPFVRKVIVTGNV
jgi:hypothetical protein